MGLSEQKLWQVNGPQKPLGMLHRAENLNNDKANV